MFFVQSKVNPKLLKPHPKNDEYYSPLPEDKYKEIKRSIAFNGIRDPIKVLPDYTVIAGHQRLKIALELELETVPVEVLDISQEEAEYLLIADNHERRQADDDPIRKARRAEFLARYWDIRWGGARNAKGQDEITQNCEKEARGQNVLLKNSENKTLKDIAYAIGEKEERTVKRLLKLNELIPELQSLISKGRLGTTAAEQLAYLSPEAQKELFDALGEAISEITVKEAKELRAGTAEAEQLKKKLEEAQERGAMAEEDLYAARKELAELKSTLEEHIENARKDAAKQEQEKIEKLEARIEHITRQKETADVRVKELAEKLGEAKAKVKEHFDKVLSEKENRIKKLEEEIAGLHQTIKELENRPPKVVEKMPEDYKKLKQELEQKNQELLALTRSQLVKKNRYMVRDSLSALAQALGKYMKDAEFKVKMLADDPEVYEDVMQFAELLDKAASEMRSWVSIKGGVVIEADFSSGSR
ncbi:ParB N-terminal domain-containing protein [Moorella naiadis]|uniref:ParB/RepB/Spo0J family partition protein n=1 Tax=Moorella naiadis (nom. illeg.) TaxID=3093670 RepID=UPI003D9C8931